MIIHIHRNIFAMTVEAIVNPVNCFGVMGKGLALEFKNRFPDYFDDYKFKCDYDKINLGSINVYRNAKYESPKFIISFPTKNHWRDYSNINDIANGLKDLANTIKALNIESIAIPALGCGLGGLQWEKVNKVMVDELQHLTNVQIFILTP